MRISLTLAAVPLLVGVVTGQSTTTNEFTIFPESRDATSRGGVPGGSTGDILIEVRGRSFNAVNGGGGLGTDAFATVGDKNISAGGTGTVSGFTGRHQDQNGSTSEQFDYVIVVESTTGGSPVPAPVGNPFGPEVLLRTSVLTTAPGGAGPAVFITNATLATPADVIPTKDTWYYGSGIQSNALWSNDGISIPMGSFNGLGSPFPNEGDNPLDPGGPSNYTWGRDVTNGSNAQATSARVHDLGVLVPTPVIRWGADIDGPAILGGGAAPNPNYGVAGIHPDGSGVGNATRVSAYSAPVGYLGRQGSSDGLGIRTTAYQGAGIPGSVHLIGGFIELFSPVPVYLNNPGFLGGISIDLSVIIALPVNLVGGGVIPPSGEVNDVLAAQTGGANALFGLTGVLTIQTIVVDSGAVNHLSNSAKVNF